MQCISHSAKRGNARLYVHFAQKNGQTRKSDMVNVWIEVLRGSRDGLQKKSGQSAFLPRRPREGFFRYAAAARSSSASCGMRARQCSLR